MQSSTERSSSILATAREVRNNTHSPNQPQITAQLSEVLSQFSHIPTDHVSSYIDHVKETKPKVYEEYIKVLRKRQDKAKYVKNLKDKGIIDRETRTGAMFLTNPVEMNERDVYIRSSVIQGDRKSSSFNVQLDNLRSSKTTFDVLVVKDDYVSLCNNGRDKLYGEKVDTENVISSLSFKRNDRNPNKIQVFFSGCKRVPFDNIEGLYYANANDYIHYKANISDKQKDYITKLLIEIEFLDINKDEIDRDNCTGHSELINTNYKMT